MPNLLLPKTASRFNVEEEKKVEIDVSSIGPQLAPFTLKQRFEKYKKPGHPGKKSFEIPKDPCTFCGVKGHNVRYCPSTATKPKESEKIPFVENLLAGAPYTEVSEFSGLSLEEAKTRVEELGEKLNEGNPWKDKTTKLYCLRAKLGFWAAIGTSKEILSWLAYGLNMIFESCPDSLKFMNHPSYFENINWVANEIVDAEKEEVIERIDARLAHIINPMQVEFNSVGKRRRCDDERWANSFLPYVKFKQESLKRQIPDIVFPDDHL
jgi:hypothetical protein